MASWDIAQAPFVCSGVGCHETVGIGEAFRLSNVVNHAGLCEACSIALDQEAAPLVVTASDFLERLRREASLVPKRRGPTLPPMRPGSQPAHDPRGQGGRQRHGVVAALRAHIDVDYRRRQTGERE